MRTNHKAVEGFGYESERILRIDPTEVRLRRGLDLRLLLIVSTSLVRLLLLLSLLSGILGHLLRLTLNYGLHVPRNLLVAEAFHAAIFPESLAAADEVAVEESTVFVAHGARDEELVVEEHDVGEAWVGG